MGEIREAGPTEKGMAKLADPNGLPYSVLEKACAMCAQRQIYVCVKWQQREGTKKGGRHREKRKRARGSNFR